MKRRKGFTLVELLAVIVILAIILAIAIPNITNVIDNARARAYQGNEKMLANAARNYLLLNETKKPSNTGDISVIDLSQLQQANIISMIKDIKDTSNQCDGKVLVYKKDASTIEYYPYLDCGSNYTSNDDFVNTNDAINSISHSCSGSCTITINVNTVNGARELHTPTTNIALLRQNLTDYSGWVLNSTGSQGSFGANGTTAENQRVLKTNPWGQTDIMWATLTNDATSDSDGGWDLSGKTIDKTKKYRFSVWIRREDTGDGRTYFGTQGNTVNSLDGVLNNNPYFRSLLISDLPAMANNWLLWVGHVHPYNYSGATDSESGIYDINGNKVYSTTDYKWISNATVGGHRTYLYYSTATTEKQYWYRPRMEVVDANAPTISDLLNGRENPNVYGYDSVNTTGAINYTVAGPGTYNFSIKLSNNSSYNFSYIVD